MGVSSGREGEWRRIREEGEGFSAKREASSFVKGGKVGGVEGNIVIYLSFFSFYFGALDLLFVILDFGALNLLDVILSYWIVDGRKQ